MLVLKCLNILPKGMKTIPLEPEDEFSYLKDDIEIEISQQKTNLKIIPNSIE